MTWINYLMQRDGSWQHIFEHNIAKNKKEVWLLDVVSLKKLKNCVQNVFWTDVFKSWITYKENFLMKLTSEPIQFGTPTFYKTVIFCLKRKILNKTDSII